MSATFSLVAATLGLLLTGFHVVFVHAHLAKADSVVQPLLDSLADLAAALPPALVPALVAAGSLAIGALFVSAEARRKPFLGMLWLAFVALAWWRWLESPFDDPRLGFALLFVPPVLFEVVSRIFERSTAEDRGLFRSETTSARTFSTAETALVGLLTMNFLLLLLPSMRLISAPAKLSPPLVREAHFRLRPVDAVMDDTPLFTVGYRLVDLVFPNDFLAGNLISMSTGSLALALFAYGFSALYGRWIGVLSLAVSLASSWILSALFMGNNLGAHFLPGAAYFALLARFAARATEAPGETRVAPIALAGCLVLTLTTLSSLYSPAQFHALSFASLAILWIPSVRGVSGKRFHGSLAAAVIGLVVALTAHLYVCDFDPGKLREDFLRLSPTATTTLREKPADAPSLANTLDPHVPFWIGTAHHYREPGSDVVGNRLWRRDPYEAAQALSVHLRYVFRFTKNRLPGPIVLEVLALIGFGVVIAKAPLVDAAFLLLALAILALPYLITTAHDDMRRAIAIIPIVALLCVLGIVGLVETCGKILPPSIGVARGTITIVTVVFAAALLASSVAELRGNEFAVGTQIVCSRFPVLNLIKSEVVRSLNPRRLLFLHQDSYWGCMERSLESASLQIAMNMSEMPIPMTEELSTSLPLADGEALLAVDCGSLARSQPPVSQLCESAALRERTVGRYQPRGTDTDWTLAR